MAINGNLLYYSAENEPYDLNKLDSIVEKTLLPMGVGLRAKSSSETHYCREITDTNREQLTHKAQPYIIVYKEPKKFTKAGLDLDFKSMDNKFMKSIILYSHGSTSCKQFDLVVRFESETYATFHDEGLAKEIHKISMAIGKALNKTVDIHFKPHEGYFGLLFDDGQRLFLEEEFIKYLKKPEVKLVR